eukprot:gene11549-biopygen8116
MPLSGITPARVAGIKGGATGSGSAKARSSTQARSAQGSLWLPRTRWRCQVRTDIIAERLLNFKPWLGIFQPMAWKIPSHGLTWAKPWLDLGQAMA